MGVIGELRAAEAREQLARTQAVAAQMVIQDLKDFLRNHNTYTVRAEAVLNHIEASQNVYQRLVTDQEAVCAEICSQWE